MTEGAAAMFTLPLYNTLHCRGANSPAISWQNTYTLRKTINAMVSGFEVQSSCSVGWRFLKRARVVCRSIHLFVQVGLLSSISKCLSKGGGIFVETDHATNYTE